MLRFAGVLTGSALAIALIAVTIGVPRFAGPAKVTDLPQAEPTERAPREPPVPEPAVQEPAIAAAGTATTPVDVNARETGPARQPAPPQSSTPETTMATDAVPHPEQSSPQSPTSNWYAFWSPFRSEIAADGFIAGLQRTTGLDYRVVKLEPGVYEVAFAYSDDSDRAQKLQQISAATGLDLSGG